MSEFATTFYFKDIFPDFQSFKTFTAEYTDISDTDDILLAYVYKYLFNKYANSNINYDTVNAFYRHFGITLEDIFYKYLKQSELVQQLYSITDDEIIETSKVFAVNVMNDASKPTNPLTEVNDFIDNQAVSRSTSNKLQKFLYTIDNISTKLIIYFIDEFKIHFMSIFSGAEFFLR